ncbi:MAG TPA: hypothetical protein PKE29_17445 [Phycisphaerales bacterium]|nr:hypothetical protein [Phycisphaerales bacterium]
MTLAQLGPLKGDAPPVPMLASPPPLAHYLVENPWPVIAGLGLAGVVALILMQRRDRLKDGLKALAAALALAAAVFAAATLITTQRETLADRTRAAATLAAAANTTDLRDLLTDRAYVRAFGPIPMPRGREDLLNTVRSTLGGSYIVKDLKIGPVRAVIDGPNVARSQVRVWATLGGEQALYNAPIGAWFRLGWTRDGAGPWRITDITVLQLDGLGANPSPND